MTAAPRKPPRPDCWIVLTGGVFAWRRRSRRAAMNSGDKPWVSGLITIRHERTGERWQRRRGTWFKTDDATTPASRGTRARKPRPPTGASARGRDGTPPAVPPPPSPPPRSAR